ncbi:nucleoside monophosphate kinase [Candidatus Uhrbacteria bacterium]|nr:nucleoside monophosphate kinase [Candidatus Uhrbacteria bacterium]
MATTHKILLFGKAGSGKDTQADLLAARLGLVNLSMGGILRAEVAGGSKTGKKIAHYLERGEIIPHDIGPRLMRSHVLEETTQRSGYVVSGFPRTLDSFQTYLAFDAPTALVVLHVPDEVARDRLIARRRHDDYEEAINKRLELFREVDEQTIAWAKTHTAIPVFEVNGALSVKHVHKTILEMVSESFTKE